MTHAKLASRLDASQAKQQPSPFKYGRQHFLDGMPRSANPFLIAAFSNGACKPEGRPSVRQWFSGWDYEFAKAAARAAITKATA